MKFLSTILFLFLTGISSVVNAAGDEKIIKSSRDFSLRCQSLTTINAQVGQIAVTVHAEYNSKKQEIEININKKTDDVDTPFKLNYPLDFDVFTQRFDSLLNKRKNDSLFVYYGSHLDVFYWIVTITEDNNLPLAGILTTSQYVMLSSNNNGKNLSHTERIKVVKNEIDSLEIKRSKLKAIEIQLEKFTSKNKADLKSDSIKLQDSIKSKKESLESHRVHIKTMTPIIFKTPEEDPTRQVLIADTLRTKDSISVINLSLNSLELRLNKISAQLNLLSNNPQLRFKLLKADSIQAQKAILDQVGRLENMHIRKISHVQYQFEKGYLERIQVYAESPATENIEIFENSYPIGFSSISNYRNFTATRLYRRSNKFDGDEKDNYIFLSDIIKLYENQLNLATRDYSPGDTTVTVYPSSNPITQLSKQRNFYIIDGKTYTDVTGLSENSPNGLVQVELSRRFNLWTHRIQVRGSNNYGFVNYVNARVNFSKIENKLKGLPLRNQLIVENKAIISPSYATNLDYLRYENLGVNLDLNIFLFDAPDFKYTLFLDAGIHYGHTPIIDSVYEISQGTASTTEAKPNDLDAHNFTFFPRAKLQLFAERRYGLSLAYQANYTWLFTNNRFKQVLSYSGKGQDLNTLSTNKTAHWSHMIEASFYIDVNPSSTTGKIFTSARFFFQQGDVNTFYPQILLGYAFNIFK